MALFYYYSCLLYSLEMALRNKNYHNIIMIYVVGYNCKDSAVTFTTSYPSRIVSGGLCHTVIIIRLRAIQPLGARDVSLSLCFTFFFFPSHFLSKRIFIILLYYIMCTMILCACHSGIELFGRGHHSSHPTTRWDEITAALSSRGVHIQYYIYVPAHFFIFF